MVVVSDSSATLEPLRSVHTNNFSPLLRELGLSLVVSTYQAGKVVLIRADGESLNTHFRVLPKPMGLAVDGAERMALGSGSYIWEFRNVPAVAPKLTPAGKHDACFLPRNIHVTGDIDILTRVVRERTDHSAAHNSLGVAYLNLGFQDKARWHFERALSLNPGFELARNNLRVLQQMAATGGKLNQGQPSSKTLGNDNGMV